MQMRAFKVTILPACMVWSHLCHGIIIANYLGVGGARQSSGRHGWIVCDERALSKYLRRNHYLIWNCMVKVNCSCQLHKQLPAFHKNPPGNVWVGTTYFRKIKYAKTAAASYGTSQKLYVSTNTICENNIPDILFLRTFNLNFMCSARGNVSYLFFFYTTNIPRSTVDYVYYMWAQSDKMLLGVAGLKNSSYCLSTICSVACALGALCALTIMGQRCAL
jgi:hypothetical protein